MDVVLIGGLPRSGTTLTGALLNSSPDVEVLNEIPDPGRFPAFAALADQVRAWSEQMMATPHETWRGMSPEVVADRILELFRAFCRTVAPVVPEGRWDAATDTPARVLALKQPNAELELPAVQRLLDPRLPRLVYCMRDPADIYRSLLSVPWGTETPPADFLGRLERSMAAAERLRSDAPQRLFVFDVERASASPQVRRDAVGRLFAWLDVAVGPEATAFVESWRPVNPSAGRFGAGEVLDPDERTERVEDFRHRFGRAGRVRRRWERLRAHRP